jgi:hypothetical protein
MAHLLLAHPAAQAAEDVKIDHTFALNPSPALWLSRRDSIDGGSIGGNCCSDKSMVFSPWLPEPFHNMTPAHTPLPEIHAVWNSLALVTAILRAWEEDRPVALLSPVLMDLPAVGDWIRGLGPRLGEGLPPGFQAILLTSGTTGQPRLVALGRESVRWNTETLARHLQLPAGQLETHLTIPLFHAFGLVLGLFMTHLRGGRLYVPPRGVGIMDALLAAPPAPDAHRLLLLVPAMVRSLPEARNLAPEVRTRLSECFGTTITGGARSGGRTSESLPDFFRR